MFLIELTGPDLMFLIVIISIVAACVIIYLLTPIIKRKQFEEQRANLKKREETFRANLKKLKPEEINSYNHKKTE